MQTKVSIVDWIQLFLNPSRKWTYLDARVVTELCILIPLLAVVSHLSPSYFALKPPVLKCYISFCSWVLINGWDDGQPGTILDYIP